MRKVLFLALLLVYGSLAQPASGEELIPLGMHEDWFSQIIEKETGQSIMLYTYGDETPDKSMLVLTMEDHDCTYSPPFIVHCTEEENDYSALLPQISIRIDEHEPIDARMRVKTEGPCSTFSIEKIPPDFLSDAMHGRYMEFTFRLSAEEPISKTFSLLGFTEGVERVDRLCRKRREPER